MGGPSGFAMYGNYLIKKNKELKDLLRRATAKPGKNLQGKQALRFKKANKQRKKGIAFDKKLIEKQLRFRIGLVIFVSIFIFLVTLLFLFFE